MLRWNRTRLIVVMLLILCSAGCSPTFFCFGVRNGTNLNLDQIRIENHQGYRFSFGVLPPGISKEYMTPHWDSPSSTPWILITGRVEDTGEVFSLKKPLTTPRRAEEVLCELQTSPNGSIDAVITYP